MEAIVYKSAGDAQSLSVSPAAMPEPLADEVIVRVHAFGLNFADIIARKGEYKEAPPFPFIPGYECAGVVHQVGADVDNIAVGDRVVGFTDFGSYAQFARVRAVVCLPMPDELSFVDAAAVPVQFGTAYHCIYQTGPVREGMTVLVHACAGGVGQAAVQLLLSAGCTIVGTCGSQAKVDLLETLGVHHRINYNAQDYEAEVLKLFPKGVDIVLNSIGGDSIKKDLNLVGTCGRVVGFGAAQLNTTGGIFSKLAIVPKVMSMLTLNAISLLMGTKSFCGVNMKRVGDDRPDILSQELKTVIGLLADGKIKSHVSQTFDWHDIGKAQEAVETRKTTGKLILTIKHEEAGVSEAEVTEEAVEAVTEPVSATSEAIASDGGAAAPAL